MHEQVLGRRVPLPLPFRQFPGDAFSRVSTKVSRGTESALTGRDPTKRFPSDASNGTRRSCRLGWIPEITVVAAIFCRAHIGFWGAQRSTRLSATSFAVVVIDARLARRRPVYRSLFLLCMPLKHRGLGDQQRVRDVVMIVNSANEQTDLPQSVEEWKCTIRLQGEAE